jgi:hypothetical protein
VSSQPQDREPALDKRESKETTLRGLIPISQDEIRQLRLRQIRAFLEFRPRKRPDHSHVRNTVCVI